MITIDPGLVLGVGDSPRLVPIPSVAKMAPKDLGTFLALFEALDYVL
jgi:hypothetical protein